MKEKTRSVDSADSVAANSCLTLTLTLTLEEKTLSVDSTDAVAANSSSD